MAQEFSKLNGYSVKDATAREQISGLNQTMGNKVNTSDIVDNLTTEAADKPLSAKQGKELSDRLTDIETKTYNQLTSESTSKDFEDALDAYNDNAVPIVYIDSNDVVCSLISAFDMQEVAAPVCYFLNADAKEIIGVSNLGSTLNFTRKKLDNPISVSYVEANEELTIGE